MRKASTELSRSRRLKRRPLLRTSSPLNPKINRELTLGLVQQTGAPQLVDGTRGLRVRKHSHPV